MTLSALTNDRSISDRADRVVGPYKAASDQGITPCKLQVAGYLPSCNLKLMDIPAAMG